MVRLKWMVQQLGIEKLVMRGGKMIAYFINDEDSPFYASDVFQTILKFIQQHPTKCSLKERNNRLSLVFEGIKKVQKALGIVYPMHKEAMLIG